MRHLILTISLILGATAVSAKQLFLNCGGALYMYEEGWFSKRGLKEPLLFLLLRLLITIASVRLLRMSFL